MARPQIYEGTLDDITARYGKELFGRRLKIVTMDEADAANAALKPFYETATPEQWGEALRIWAASHDPTTHFFLMKFSD